MPSGRKLLAFAFAAGIAAACSSSSPLADAGSDAATAPDVLLLPEAGPPPDAAADAASDAAADAADADASVHVCPTGGALDCSPGSGTGDANQCFDGPSCWVSKVQKAVNTVVSQNPSWFDFNNQWNCPMILDVDSFMNAVVAQLVAVPLCAIRDPNAPGEEVTVKHDNAFTENFDIVASTGCARSGTAIYTGWCAPAWW
jgi:hypothetical protein